MQFRTAKRNNPVTTARTGFYHNCTQPSTMADKLTTSEIGKMKVCDCYVYAIINFV